MSMQLRTKPMKAWEEKLSTAELLVSTEGGRIPHQEHLKTAIGDAYFAVFHGLQTMCANCFIGEENDPETSDKAWLEAYRSLKHGVIYSACLHPDLVFFPDHIRSLAESIAYLQDARQSIEYHPRTIVDLENTKTCVRLAKQSLKSMREGKKKDRIAFSAWVAFERKGGVADARKRARSKNPDALELDKK